MEALCRKTARTLPFAILETKGEKYEKGIENNSSDHTAEPGTGIFLICRTKEKIPFHLFLCILIKMHACCNPILWVNCEINHLRFSV